MGLKIGKALGRFVGGGIKAVPAIAAGFAAGGQAGAGLAALGSLKFGGGGPMTASGAPPSFTSVAARFAPGRLTAAPMGGMGGETRMDVMAKEITRGATFVTQLAIDAATKVASFLGLRVPAMIGSAFVIGIGRRILPILRRFGPGALLAILTAEELAHLLLATQAGRKRRRLNSLNPKALNRALRRLVGFERRAERVSEQLALVCRAARPGRVGRGRRRAVIGRACPRCRRAPCVCP